MTHQEFPKSFLSTSVGREVHSGKMATVNDYVSASFTADDMFEVSAHASFNNTAHLSVLSNQSLYLPLQCKHVDSVYKSAKLKRDQKKTT